MVVEIENERGPVRRTLGLVGSLLLAGALPAVGQPSADEIEVAGVAYSIEVERHNGYEAIAWSQVPESVVSGSFQRDGAATGQVAGASLELRSGSPFGRYGDSVFQLTNPPYRLQGEVWVPLELLVEWLPRVQPTSAGAAPAAAASEVAQPIPAAAMVDGVYQDIFEDRDCDVNIAVTVCHSDCACDAGPVETVQGTQVR